MDKVIRYRLYPDEKQLNIINSIIGCCRFVYNQALNWKKLAYAADGTKITYNDCAYGVTCMKKMYPWLREADSAALQQSLRNLENAYKQFFTVKGTGYPKFKSKHKSRKCYRTVATNGNIAVLEKAVKLPKLGNVRAVIHRVPGPDWRLTSCSVAIEADGHVYASCHFVKAETQQDHVIDPENAIGLDYKSDGLYMDSEGHICDNPKNYRESQKKLAKYQRQLKHKKVGSNNYRKHQQRIAVVHRKISNRRKDFLHKESLRIANLYDLVCVEDLNMRHMSGKTANRSHISMGKATMDNAYGKFLNFLDYKLTGRGKKLIRIDRYYPSSQICHICGKRHPETKDLNVRKWICRSCRTSHDRDLNAAINIREEGKRIYRAM